MGPTFSAAGTRYNAGSYFQRSTQAYQQHTNANRTHMHTVRRLASLKRAQMQQMMHGRI